MDYQYRFLVFFIHQHQYQDSLLFYLADTKVQLAPGLLRSYFLKESLEIQKSNTLQSAFTSND